MNCPACSQPLRPIVEWGIQLDECEACEGIWFDDAELKRLLELGGDAARAADQRASPAGSPVPEHSTAARASRPCPRCREGMDRYRYNYSSPIELESCSRCGGIWVDSGELEAIADFNDREAADLAAGGNRRLMAAAALAKMEGEKQESIRRARWRIHASEVAMQGRFGYLIDPQGVPLRKFDKPDYS